MTKSLNLSANGILQTILQSKNCTGFQMEIKELQKERGRTKKTEGRKDKIKDIDVRLQF